MTGSTDGMAEVARDLRSHTSRCAGSSKADARWEVIGAELRNLRTSDAEIVVCVDADGELGPEAIQEIVQPFQDPRVGAVFGKCSHSQRVSKLCSMVPGVRVFAVHFHWAPPD